MNLQNCQLSYLAQIKTLSTEFSIEKRVFNFTQYGCNLSRLKIYFLNALMRATKMFSGKNSLK